jgi:hypothetical protein
MSEAAKESLESNHESRLTPDASRLTVFEPEVLAFCCEH